MQQQEQTGRTLQKQLGTAAAQLGLTVGDASHSTEEPEIESAATDLQVPQTELTAAVRDPESTAAQTEDQPESMSGVTAQTVVQQKHETAEKPLPNLDAINPDNVVIPVINDEVLRREAAREKEWAQGAASRRVAIEKKLTDARREIESVSGKIPKARADGNDILVEKYEKYLQVLLAAEATLTEENMVLAEAGSEGVRKSREFSELIVHIRETDSEDFAAVQRTIGNILKSGRYRLATSEEVNTYKAARKNPPGVVFFAGKTYVPNSDPNSGFYILNKELGKMEPAPGQKILETEFRRMTNAAKESHHSRKEAKISSLKERGAGSQANGILEGKKAFYYLHSPKEPDGHGGERPERHVLIEVRDINRSPRGDSFLVVRAVDAVGDHSEWMLEGWSEDGKKDFLPLSWIRRNQVITRERLPEEDFNRAMRLVRMIRFLIQRTNQTTTGAQAGARAVSVVTETPILDAPIEKPAMAAASDV